MKTALRTTLHSLVLAWLVLLGCLVGRASWFVVFAGAAGSSSPPGAGAVTSGRMIER